MTASKRIHKFQFYIFKKLALIFWAVLVILNIFSYSLTRLFQNNIKFGIFRDGQLISISGANFMPILIFFIIYGIIMYHENFRLALNFGAARKDFYKSVIVINLISTLTFSLIQTVFQTIDMVLIKNIGMNPVADFHLFSNPLLNFLALVMSFASILVFVSSIMNIIGILQYKYSYKFWIGFGILVFLSAMLFGVNILRFFLVLKDISIQIASILGIFTLPFLSIILSSIFYLIGYILFRRVNG